MAADPAEPGVAEPEARVHIARLTVENEVFDVSADPRRLGSYDYDWVSGPNEGYGFSESRSDRQPTTLEEHVEGIRTFLTQVDPVTGHIE